MKGLYYLYYFKIFGWYIEIMFYYFPFKINIVTIISSIFTNKLIKTKCIKF